MPRRQSTELSISASLPKVPPTMEVPMLRGLVSQLVEAVQRLQERVDQLQAAVDRLEPPSARRAARRSK